MLSFALRPSLPRLLDQGLGGVALRYPNLDTLLPFDWPYVLLQVLLLHFHRLALKGVSPVWVLTIVL